MADLGVDVSDEIDLEALEALAQDASVFDHNDVSVHAFDVFLSDADEALFNAMTPQAVLSLIERVRKAEEKLDRIRAYLDEGKGAYAPDLYAILDGAS